MTSDTTSTTAATAAPTTSALPLPAGQWTLDAFHSSVSFTIRHLGISKVRGRFAEFDAALTVGETLADTSVTATIAVASIDTGNSDRDAHVLAPDLLDVASRPTLAFRSTRVLSDGEDWILEGELTIGDVTRPQTLELEFGGLVDNALDGRVHAGFEASGELRRSDFGLNFGAADAMLGGVVKIVLDVQFVAPEKEK